MERGKYQSLTLINWNGFFARTFDIDNLVTTLSGGNGAGKSTTMAAFITALIPDQSLLHFRNTTEAGSSSASRDKGLHGKLKGGVCYSALDVINSQGQRFLFAVRLQQVAGRDKKVDIKPFCIQGLPSHLSPMSLLMERISDHQARPRTLDEVRKILSKYPEVQCKVCQSVADYHTLMFDVGVLPKKLRTSGDRGKFYRLIEASLYGGISSTITRSLRDYLLPQNGGVKKAFQDMESALRENRMTLEAIKVTQRDRDLFKHLIAESTQYVAADYMRHVNERDQQIESALLWRNEWTHNRTQQEQHQNALLMNSERLSVLNEEETTLDEAYQHALTRWQLVQSAEQQQEKMLRYQDDLDELVERVEEQAMVVEEIMAQLTESEESSELAESEVDSLQSQLADFQQALNTQQTRALQYQQAVTALQQANQLLPNMAVTPETARQCLQQLETDTQAQTQALLALKHRLDMADAATKQFEQAHGLVNKIYGETIAPQEAFEKGELALAQAQDQRREAETFAHWQGQYRELSHRVEQQQQLQKWVQKYAEYSQVTLTSELVWQEEQTRQEMQLDTLLMQQEEQQTQAQEQRHTQETLQRDIAELEKQAPTWIAASDALSELKTSSEFELNDQDAVMAAMQTSLDNEREMLALRDRVATEKTDIERQMRELGQLGGGSDGQLRAIADALGGTLLSDIYDDVALNDAPYFSALYGPARHAIIVPDFLKIEDKLTALQDCPDDLYLIEGDANAFDESSFALKELNNAVCVHLNERQIRYSRYPEVPLFGRAAREKQLETLRLMREDLVESHAKAAFDAQKWQRIYQSFNRFVAKHLSVAFLADPEVALKTLKAQLNGLLRDRHQWETQVQHQRQQIQRTRDQLALLTKISPLVMQLGATDAKVACEQAKLKLDCAQTAQAALNRHQKSLDLLSSMISALEVAPDQFDQLRIQYTENDAQLQRLKQGAFAVADVAERRAHFGYADAVALVSESSKLNSQLKEKLTVAEQSRHQWRGQLTGIRQKMNEANQLWVSLQTAQRSKAETLQEFQREFEQLGILLDGNSLAHATDQKETLLNKLHQLRQRRSEIERALTSSELALKSLNKTQKKSEQNYHDARRVVVLAKRHWCAVLRLAKDNGVDRRLHRREMAYMTSEELRSISDKALGALRLAVADNEILRDALRASEDNAHPERKVAFYIAVYQHLRERIRQDIIRSDDPMEAIEEMEVELARLTEELTSREQRLALSSDTVAGLIRKTIQREQNRIRVLNQGLMDIRFGQVNGVRLKVKVRESHEVLLHGLAQDQEKHKDVFERGALTFSEAMAKVFQRLNPHIDVGNRSSQILGDELLDYRNYLELSIEVNRGSDGWLQAESGALSTGEAIGTGQAILLMVVQSWEEESRRLRGKEIVPCRLLFLDEAARLDGKSIATLFELCERLDMQLLIAAPENISPDKGTTYKLVRKIVQGREHVHVVGLKGFAGANSLSLSAV